MNNMKQKILSLLVLLLTAATGAWADETPIVTITATGSGPAYSVEGIVTLETGSAGYGAGYGWVSGSPNNLTVTAADGVTITKVKFNGNQGGSWEDTESPFQVLLQNYYVKNASGTSIGSDDGVTSIEVYGTIAPAGPKVTLNEAKTEASFDMQTFDMDVDYELVRDMSVQMTAQVGDDATKEPRYRVQWNGENWVPADMTQQQVAALFSVNDLVENTTLAPENYFVSIYAVNEQGETTGNPMTFLNFTFAPGRYAVTASAMLGSPTYDGTTALSNTFELFQGYEVEIAANSFATYYKDEALTIDESTAEDAALYTISEVTATEAVLSSEIEAAPSSTPLLVFNGSDKARTILLIPTNEPNLALTVAPEFMGTATAKTFSEADMEAANFYVLTDANAFVWVKGAGQIAANKCWLQIPKTAPNNTRAIVFDNDATSINEELRVKNEESAGAVFDLSGRKVANGKWLNGKLPNGVYIINGKKVVIK